MSLLLEALKKAELAKQAASQQPENETTLPLPSRSAGTDDPLAGFVPGEPLDLNLTTKDQLPDPNQPIEFSVDDINLNTGDAAPAMLDLRLDDTPPLEPERTFPPTPASITPAAVATAAAGAAAIRARAAPRSEAKEPVRPATKPWMDDSKDERATAKQVFAAKQMDYNPRKPFWITVGTLGVVAAVAVGYFVWELQPKSNFATARPAVTPAPSAPVASTPPTPAPQPRPVAPVPTQTASAPISTPSATSSPPAPAPTASVAPPAAPTAVPPTASASKPPEPAARPVAARPTPPAPTNTTPPRERPARVTPTAVPPQAAAEPAKPVAPAAAARTVDPTAPIAVRRRAPQLDPTVERAFAAFQAGDLEQARQAYLQVLANDALNRDALLGLAAIDVRTQNYDSAEARYVRILEVDPRDPHAAAGLTGLRSAVDPLQSESRLKNLIAQQPDSAPLHFSLGNQLAAQSRWDDAQQAYFKAYAAEPDNPDFALNLAISLDQLRQRKLALEYYQRALKLGQGRPTNFDRAQISARIQELQR